MNNKTLLLLMLSAPHASFADQRETACQHLLAKRLFGQQVIFSNRQLHTDVRRHAERAIDHAREVLQDSDSFCDADEALTLFVAKHPKSDTKSSDGEVDFPNYVPEYNFRYGRNN